ncbi:MAG: hypothetical protein OXG64_01045 [Chloroflexi bacterium]|nr:hypothetical protein [Chloroflexota bacterium]
MSATIETRLTRLEQRAQSHDDTMNSVLQILERMDQRLAMLESIVATLESNVATLMADMAAVKATTADTNERVRVRGFNQ